MDTKIEELILNDIKSFLINRQICLSAENRDGRVNSIQNEDQIISFLMIYNEESEILKNNNLEIYIPKARNWFDFSIQSKDGLNKFFVPVNIKVSSFKGADNCSSKSGVFYALTGIIPMTQNISNCVSWDGYFKALDENMGKNKEKDYYYLVVNKEDTKEVFWTSLKSLNVITPNSNNLPFQCNWGNNKERIQRNYEQAKYFILSAFKESIYKDNKRELFDKYILKHIVFPNNREEE